MLETFASESPIDDSSAVGTGPTLDLPASEVDGNRLWAFWEGVALSFPLPPKGTLIIGRSMSCPIRINHGSISRQHATLELSPLPHISDMGSANGTRVAGRTLEPHVFVPVATGDVIQVGAILLALAGRNASPRGGEDPLQRLERLVRLAASAHSNVLLVGEEGTDKEDVARRIHRASRRANGAFVRIDAAAATEAVLDVSGGTLFIDEVGELPDSEQKRLAGILDRADRHLVADTRFITTSSRDLRSLVLAGTFREDLYRLLNGISIEVPSLRECRAQLADLAKSLLANICAAHGLPQLALGREALTRIRMYDWPGNVCELRDTLERAALGSKGSTLDVSALPTAAPDVDLRRNIANYERQRIIEALEKCGGNQTKAAKVLGIARRTLVAKLAALDVPRPRRGHRS
jgi:DNA-binding NtrC family response regulator